MYRIGCESHFLGREIGGLFFCEGRSHNEMERKIEMCMCVCAGVYIGVV